MNYRWIGALLIMAGCGGFGFTMASNYRKEERFYQDLIHALQTIENELQYHLSPLSELCRSAAKQSRGIVKQLLLNMAQELESQLLPDAGCCMYAALHRFPEIPSPARRICKQLGQSLGQYDLPGQLSGLAETRERCIQELSRMDQDRDIRIRNYRTLGLCAGAAIVILFI